jgi:hypothetical protein
VDELLDLTLGGYTLVTYRLSNLNPGIASRGETIVVTTRESEAHEIAALGALCGTPVNADCGAMLKGLAQGEAVVMPGIQESGAEPRRFRLAPRLTRHVRHRTKYLDMSVAESRGFHFAALPGGNERLVRTLRSFMEIVASAPTTRIDGYLRRSDFSRWVRDVFRDYTLAAALDEIEQAYRLGQAPGVNEAIVQAIRSRYELGEDAA